MYTFIIDKMTCTLINILHHHFATHGIMIFVLHCGKSTYPTQYSQYPVSQKKKGFQSPPPKSFPVPGKGLGRVQRAYWHL